NLYYGWYFVHVTDALGCETDDTIYINPGPCCESVYIPNAFTPNSDGENDQWKLVTSTGLNIEQFAVFNRWGEKVWFTRDQRSSWDGKQNGADVQVGTYFYLLRYRCLTDGKMYVKKGDITVLR
ncbi:MAG TPA: gliding motility-associated C-terminal domain-containing protein, partial [Chitinophagaceae bacterium]|nr:gliding motility-associated C-terminal domain-containing protein [Chitinophagaceae bacterium]